MHHTTGPLCATQIHTARLRVMATTDLHMELRGFDYVTESASQYPGLAGIATLIAQARSEAQDLGCASVLVDNGDLLQGNALANWLAHQPVGPDHPVVSAMNTLRYDALGIGNHDLDHGMSYLVKIAEHLDMPVIASNLTGSALRPIAQSALVPCTLPLPGSETCETLTLGILSVLPEQTAVWNDAVLSGCATVTATRDAVQQAIPDLRARGADLILVLAHMGLTDEQNDLGQSGGGALALAQIEGVDALIAGHTHLRFPGNDHLGHCGVDTDLGTLAGRPAIMAGHAGSDLAIMDLTLKKAATGGWVIAGHTSRLSQNTPETLADPAILRLSDAAHTATRAQLARQIGVTTQPLHNYFSMVKPTRTAALMAHAKLEAAREALAHGPVAHLPRLATSAAHTAGGRGGMDHYLHIPTGPILGRHLAGLNPYANKVSAFLQTGAQLRKRLAHSTRIFATLMRNAPDQPLLNPDVPSYDFDTIYGITYTIDPTLPQDAPEGRVKSLRYKGEPIEDAQQFVLVTNQFRAAGGGGYDRPCPQDILLDTPVNLHKALKTVLSSPQIADSKLNTPWTLSPSAPVQAVLETATGAVSQLSDIAQYAPEIIETCPQGFLRLRLSL